MEYILLFLVSLFAGALNAVAGGGSFFIFPALLFTGMNPIAANATTTMAVWPGTIASAVAYKKEVHVSGRHLPALASMSIIGAAIGAFVLLKTPEMVFSWLIPYLLLFATLIFAFGNKIAKKLHRKSGHYLGEAGALLMQLLIAVYGGYFGGGMGIMVLAMLSLMGLSNIHEMNALKAILDTIINAVAVIVFTSSGIIAWPEAMVMLTGCIIGGYAGAKYAQKVSADKVRNFVIVVGSLITLYFFIR